MFKLHGIYIFLFFNHMKVGMHTQGISFCIFLYLIFEAYLFWFSFNPVAEYSLFIISSQAHRSAFAIWQVHSLVKNWLWWILLNNTCNWLHVPGNGMCQADAKLQWDIDNQLHPNLDTDWVEAFWIYPSCKCVCGLSYPFSKIYFPMFLQLFLVQ